MYPVIVIILVRLQLSFEHTYGFSIVSQAQEHDHKNMATNPTIGQLRFPSTPENTMTRGENNEILEESREDSNV